MEILPFLPASDVHARVGSFPAQAASPEYYEYVATGYDRMAATYDQVEGRNSISERVRSATLSAALDVFRPGDRVLELGCGTGRDALALARRGLTVTATDVSPEMVATTRHRAEREALGSRVSVVTASASQAARLDGPFDGVYSNGAVLNLEPDLPGVARGLSRSVRAGGHVVVTAANRLSLFELFLYPLVGRPRKAFRKLGASVPIPISREGFGKHFVVPTRFLTPKEFHSVFRPSFALRFQRGLQVVSPPWNLVDMADLFRSAVEPLERVEDLLGAMPMLRDLGAITLFTLQRTSR